MEAAEEEESDSDSAIDQDVCLCMGSDTIIEHRIIGFSIVLINMSFH
jgi:hypothetical protein